MISKYALAFAIAGAAAVPSIAAAQAQPAPQAADAGTDAEDIVVTGRFIDTGAKSAMKMDVPVLDTPFSVSSYSGAFVKSLETQSLADLYNYMTGLKKSGVTAYDITLRGFKSSGDDRNAIMVDGLPGLAGRYGSPPTIGIDHIELVKGPMSVLYGQIQPGGFVNMITKKPQAKAVTTIEARYNTYLSSISQPFDSNSFSGAIDSTGAITEDGDLMYRLVAQQTANKNYRIDDYTDQTFVSPSLTWNIDPETTLTAQLEYRKTRQHFDIGIAAPFDGLTSATSTIYDINAVAAINTSYTQPDNYREEEGQVGSFYIQRRFGDWKLNVGFRHVRYQSDQQDISSSGVNRYNGELRVTRRARQLQTTRKYDYGDVNLTGTFDTGPIQHKLLIGINGGIDSVRENRTKFFDGAARNTTTGVCPAGGICLDVALYNPNLSTIPAFNTLPSGPDSGLTDRNILSKNYGIYFSDLITLTDWLKVSGSARKFSEFSRVYTNTPLTVGDVKYKTTSKDFLPSVGILLQPTKNITIYGSYAESFVPPDPGLIDLTGAVGNFNPITGEQYEVGIKTEKLLDGKLGFTAALYQIDQVGQITQTICPAGSCSVQLGSARSRGFELEGTATPMPNWQVIFGYSRIDAKVTATGTGFGFQQGLRLPNVAENAANIWTRYDFDNGLGFGLGVTYTGQREGVLPTQSTDLKRLDLPAYTVVDFGVYYTKEHYSINLKVGNLLNERYFENSGAGSQGRVQIVPGSPRYATLTARYNF